jgi:hypothetical protein
MDLCRMVREPSEQRHGKTNVRSGYNIARSR